MGSGGDQRLRELEVDLAAELDDQAEGRRASGPANVTALLTRQAGERGSTVALIDHRSGSRRALTWGDLEHEVELRAAALAARGWRASQRLGLSDTGADSFMISYLAALRLGVVAVPLGPGASDLDLLGATDATVDDADTDAETDDDQAAARTSRSAHPVISPRDPEAPAAIFATAGTTRPSRLVVLSHRALLAGAAQLAATEAPDDPTVSAGTGAGPDLTRPDDTVLSLFPLAHPITLNSVWSGVLHTGATLVVCEPPDPARADRDQLEQVLDVVAEEQVSTLWLTAHQVRAFADLADGVEPTEPCEPTEPVRIDRRWGSLRLAVVTGAAVPADVAARFTAATGVAVVQLYGLTEMAGAVSAGLAPGGVGPGLPGVEVRIRSEEAEEPGEVLVRGAGLFSGYWRGEAQAPGEWFGTGDIGFLDAAGLHLVDRDRDLVLVNGFWVYPRELEMIIEELPGVRESAVVGVPDDGGERIAAVVVGDRVSVQDVLTHCDRLPGFKRPSLVQLWDGLPRTATGKVRKSAVREQLVRS